jgi:hypothetical protein
LVEEEEEEEEKAIAMGIAEAAATTAEVVATDLRIDPNRTNKILGERKVSQIS